MFGGDDDLFGFAPDFDGDGDHDLVDFLILDDILTEEENLSSDIDDRDPLLDDEDDWREDTEDGTEYLLDPYDYDSEKSSLLLQIVWQQRPRKSNQSKNTSKVRRFTLKPRMEPSYYLTMPMPMKVPRICPLG